MRADEALTNDCGDSNPSLRISRHELQAAIRDENFALAAIYSRLNNDTPPAYYADALLKISERVMRLARRAHASGEER